MPVLKRKKKKKKVKNSKKKKKNIFCNVTMPKDSSDLMPEQFAWNFTLVVSVRFRKTSNRTNAITEPQEPFPSLVNRFSNSPLQTVSHELAVKIKPFPSEFCGAYEYVGSKVYKDEHETKG